MTDNAKKVWSVLLGLLLIAVVLLAGGIAIQYIWNEGVTHFVSVKRTNLSGAVVIATGIFWLVTGKIGLQKPTKVDIYNAVQKEPNDSDGRSDQEISETS